MRDDVFCLVDDATNLILNLVVWNGKHGPFPQEKGHTLKPHYEGAEEGDVYGEGPPLAKVKAVRQLQFDARTFQLLGEGFKLDDLTFSLDQESRLNWLGILDQGDKNLYPIDMTSMEGQVRTWSDYAEMAPAAQKAIARYREITTGATNLRKVLNKAETVKDAQAIQDDRS